MAVDEFSCRAIKAIKKHQKTINIFRLYHNLYCRFLPPLSTRTCKMAEHGTSMQKSAVADARKEEKEGNKWNKIALGTSSPSEILSLSSGIIGQRQSSKSGQLSIWPGRSLVQEPVRLSGGACPTGHSTGHVLRSPLSGTSSSWRCIRCIHQGPATLSFHKAPLQHRHKAICCHSTKKKNVLLAEPPEPPKS